MSSINYKKYSNDTGEIGEKYETLINNGGVRIVYKPTRISKID
jgi:hypothetical protein